MSRAAIVALLIDELVDIVERVLPRWVSVIVVLLGVLTIVAGITIGVANNVLDSLDELQTTAPKAAAGLEERYNWARDIGVAGRVESFVDELNDRIRERAVTEVAGDCADLRRDRDPDAVPPQLRTALLRCVRDAVPRRPP